MDVTLACDGKLLQAHKIVLAICSPYFQEMFITNPCRHPISEYYFSQVICAISLEKACNDKKKLIGFNYFNLDFEQK